MKDAKVVTDLKKERAAARRRRKLYLLRNHPFVVPVCTFLVLFFLTMVAFVYFNGLTVTASDSHIVRLSIDGKQQAIPTRATTVADLLQRTKITLHDGDIVEPSQDTPIIDDNFHVNVYRAHPVTIFDGDKTQQALSAATTPRSVVAQAGIKVFPEDTVTIEGSEGILKEKVLGQKVVIDRALLVYLNLYGTPIELRTHSKTVGQLIKEKNINLAADDTLQPSADTRLTANMQIFVIRNGLKIVTSEDVIPMPIQRIDDFNLSFGTTVIRQQGSEGKKIITYQIDIQGGKEVSRQIIQEVVATPAVTQIIAVGKAVYIPGDSTVLMAAAGIAKNDYPYVNYIISRESGWCPTKLQGQVGYCPAFPPTYIPPNLGYGLGQATPGSKMSTSGADWASNPVTQLRWCTGYAIGRYGSWEAAYNHWLAYHNW